MGPGTLPRSRRTHYFDPPAWDLHCRCRYENGSFNALIETGIPSLSKIGRESTEIEPK